MISAGPSTTDNNKFQVLPFSSDTKILNADFSVIGFRYALPDVLSGITVNSPAAPKILRTRCPAIWIKVGSVRDTVALNVSPCLPVRICAAYAALLNSSNVSVVAKRILIASFLEFGYI